MFYSLLQGNEFARASAWILGFVGFMANINVLYQRYKARLRNFNLHNQRQQRSQYSVMKSRKVINYLTCHLAIADIFGAIYLIIIASADLYYGYNYPAIYQNLNPMNQTNIWSINPLCKIGCLRVFTAPIVSIFITSIIALDRFVAVIMPNSNARLNIRKCRIIFCICWCLSLSFGLFPAIRSIISIPQFKSSFEFPDNICLYRDSNRKLVIPFIIFRQVMIYMCCMIITILYIIIISYIKYKNSGIGSQLNQIERRILLIMCLITFTNMFSLTPSTITLVLGSELKLLSETVYVHYTVASIIFNFSNIIVNPFIYMLNGRSFIYHLFQVHRKKVNPTRTIAVKSKNNNSTTDANT